MPILVTHERSNTPANPEPQALLISQRPISGSLGCHLKGSTEGRKLTSSTDPYTTLNPDPWDAGRESRSPIVVPYATTGQSLGAIKGDLLSRDGQRSGKGDSFKFCGTLHESVEIFLGILFGTTQNCTSGLRAIPPFCLWFRVQGLGLRV